MCEGTKTCTNCGEEKLFSHFNKHNQTSDGFRPRCKICDKEKTRKRVENSNQILSDKKCRKCGETKYKNEFNKAKNNLDGLQSYCKDCEKLYKTTNRGRYQEVEKQYREENKEWYSEYNKRYYEKNKDWIINCNKEWRKNNKERNKENQKRYREENKELLREYIKSYREENRDWLREYGRRWSLHQYHSNPKFKLNQLMRDHVKRCLGGISCKNVEQRLGYTSTDLKKHLELLFTEGMSWDNHGDWHIDHIKSVSEYLEEGETDPSVVNALENLQPLWSKDNLSKSNKKYE